MKLTRAIAQLRLERDQITKVMLALKPLLPQQNGSGPDVRETASSGFAAQPVPEIIDYLRFVLAHNLDCKVKDCQSYLVLQQLCEFAMGRISVSTIYSRPLSPGVHSSVIESSAEGV